MQVIRVQEVSYVYKRVEHTWEDAGKGRKGKVHPTNMP